MIFGPAPQGPRPLINFVHGVFNMFKVEHNVAAAPNQNLVLDSGARPLAYSGPRDRPPQPVLAAAVGPQIVFT